MALDLRLLKKALELPKAPLSATPTPGGGANLNLVKHPEIGRRPTMPNEVTITAHGGGGPGKYLLQGFNSDPVLPALGGKQRQVTNTIYQNPETNAATPDFWSVQNSLKDVNADTMTLSSCNVDGGGCPEFAEQLYGKPLKQVNMTPPGYITTPVASQAPYTTDLIKGITGAAPQHAYLKQNGNWVDSGVDASSRTIVDSVVPTAATTGTAAMLGASAPFRAVPAIGLGVNTAMETADMLRGNEGMGQHLDKMDFVNESPQTGYLDKVLYNLGRPMGSILGGLRGVKDLIMQPSTNGQAVYKQGAIKTEYAQHTDTYQGPRGKSAVIIKGNPEYIKGNPHAHAFYNSIASHLRDKGYAVKFNPGKPHTEPPKADLWVGHSRGVDRLRFAPKGTKTVAFGVQGGVNHPLDKAFHPGQVPNVFHYQYTQEMKDHINKIATLNLFGLYEAKERENNRKRT